MHDFHFPGESAQYRRARDQLLEDELALRREIERLAVQRRALPLGGRVPTDYVFHERTPDAGGIRQVRLSELFDTGKDTLFLYSFMFIPTPDGNPIGQPCPSCTSIIDAMDGALPHITPRVNVAVAAKAPIDAFHEHRQRRGWRHARLLSSSGNSYNGDYGAENIDGIQYPQATVFVKRKGSIHHFWSSELFFVGGEGESGPRHVDFMWPMWAVFDRTPDGRGPDDPKLEYPESRLE